MRARAGCCCLAPMLLVLVLCAVSSVSGLEHYTLQDNAGSLSGRLERRYDNADYDSFIGLMGRRSTGINAVPPLRRDMDDIFVGLLGRRSSESGNRPWRGERRGGFFIKNGKLRFQRDT